MDARIGRLMADQGWSDETVGKMALQFIGTLPVSLEVMDRFVEHLEETAREENSAGLYEPCVDGVIVPPALPADGDLGSLPVVTEEEIGSFGVTKAAVELARKKWATLPYHVILGEHEMLIRSLIVRVVNVGDYDFVETLSDMGKMLLDRRELALKEYRVKQGDLVQKIADAMP